MSVCAQRRDRLRRLIKQAGGKGLLVTSFTNVTYLTGFTGDDSYLFVTGDEEILISDFRYVTQLAEECPGLKLDIRAAGVSILDAVVKVAGKSKVSSLGIEGESMPVRLHEQLADKLPKVSLVTTADLVEELRVIKDRDEVEQTREACRYAEKAFEVIRASLRPDQTEREVAHEIENQVRLFGGTGCSFPPIVAVGAWAALPHATPGERRIGEAPFVLIDWGAKGKLYMSDLTRVLVTGKIPAKFERVYNIVLRAQQRAIEAIRPGATCEQVDAVARGVITRAGFGKQFGHGLGHGVGLEIHEAPRLARNQDRPLRPGMIITVEPGIYIPGWGGVRIEDDVLVTRSGHEVLTSVPKQFAEVVVG